MKNFDNVRTMLLDRAEFHLLLRFNLLPSVQNISLQISILDNQQAHKHHYTYSKLRSGIPLSPRLEFHMFSHYMHFCIDYLKIRSNFVPLSGCGFMRTSLVSGSFICELNTSIHILTEITSIEQKKLWFPCEVITDRLNSGDCCQNTPWYESWQAGSLERMWSVEYVQRVSCVEITVIWGMTPCWLITAYGHLERSL